MTRLILHIGHPKCGSTSVQSLLWQNRLGLAAQGCFLLGNQLTTDLDNAIEWPLWYLDAASRTPGLVEADLAEQAQTLQRLDARALVLSAENLALPGTARAVLPLLERFETSIIYYVRRQDHFLLSSWRQWGLKRGITLSQHLLRRMAEGKPDFPGTLAFWSAHVPVEHIHVRFIEQQWLDGGDLATDLFGALGFAADDMSLPQATNPSPDRAVLLFLSRHSQLFESEHDDRPIQVMASADLQPPRRMTLDRHTQKSIKLVHDPRNVELCRRYMAREDGDQVLAPDGPASPADRLTPADIARLEEILPRIGDATIAKLLRADLDRGFPIDDA